MKITIDINQHHIKGALIVGTTGFGEVCVTHPDIDPDKDGIGFIIFSPQQAHELGATLIRRALDAAIEPRPQR